MTKHLALLTTAILLTVVPQLAIAQHDVHRNATQGIARDDLKWAVHQLEKADPDDPETHFVKMMVALKQGEVANAEQSAQAAMDAGLPLARLVVGPRELLAPLYDTPAFKNWRAQQPDLHLLHGPMVGSVTDSRASFWVRTARETDVQIVVGVRKSQIVKTSSTSDFTAIATVDSLEPETQYDYHVLLDGERVKAENTSFRTFPASGQGATFSVAFGGGAGYVPEWEHMWDTIRSRKPHALLMLGDNVYIDQPEYLLCQHYCYYRRQARPEWRRLVASTAVYSIYDDHDFGTNDCVPGPEIEKPIWKREVWNVFRQNWVNPRYGGGKAQPGCWYDFYIGDVHFIMIDGRYYRDRKGGSMLGPVQKAWLLKTLNESKGTFKVLASPVPWTEGIKPGSKDPWDGFPEEREEIFQFAETNKIDGLVLIAADRHRTDLRVTARTNGYDLYEFESSRLTNRHTHGVVKKAGLVWGYNKTCSFALMRFDTKAADPKVTFECISIDGDVVHQHDLPLSSLQHQ